MWTSWGVCGIDIGTSYLFSSKTVHRRVKLMKIWAFGMWGMEDVWLLLTLNMLRPFGVLFSKLGHTLRGFVVERN